MTQTDDQHHPQDSAPHHRTTSLRHPTVHAGAPTRAGRARISRRVRRRRAVAGLIAATVVAGGAFVGVRSAAAAEITVVEDGRARVVHTHDGTVAQTLRTAGLTLADHDQVTPSLRTRVGDGDRVEVVRAKDVTLLVDGRARVASIAALTVAGARNALGVRADAVVRASRGADRALAPGAALADGTHVEVRNPQTVTVQADGRTRTVVTTAGTPAQVLAQLGLHAGPKDLLTRTRDGKTATSTLVASGDQVRLVRVKVSTTRRTQVPAPVTHTVTDASRPAGQVAVRTAGKAGSKVTVTTTTTHDGKVVRRTSSTSTVTKPTDRVVVKGTKKPAPARTSAPRAAVAASAAPASSSSGLNWDALAQCESGGNPAAVSPGGLYRGLYQFSMTTWASVGGSGDPAAASPAEQTRRAQILYDRAGRGQWPVCGKRL